MRALPSGAQGPVGVLENTVGAGQHGLPAPAVAGTGKHGHAADASLQLRRALLDIARPDGQDAAVVGQDAGRGLGG